MAIIATNPKPKTTIYPNIKATTNGQTHDFGKVMQAIKAGKWRDQVTKYRKTRNANDKKALPYFTGSGTFTTRKESGLIKHNGRLIIDIDKHDPDDIKAQLGVDPYAEYIFTSCGGNGAAVVFKIHPEKHAASFKALEAYLKENYGITIDQATKDVSRARFVSYDPNIYLNEHAATFYPPKTPKNDPTITAIDMINNAPEGLRHNTLLRAARLLGGYAEGGLITKQHAEEVLVKAWESRPSNKDYDHAKTIKNGLNYGYAMPINPDTIQTEQQRARDAYKVACLKNAEGFALDSPETKAFIEASEDPKTTKSAFAAAYENNKEQHGDKYKPAIQKAEDFIKKRYNLKRNTITKRVELHPDGDNANIHSIYRELQHNGVKFGLEKIKSLFQSDFVEDFNPFLDYFKGLPAHDGEDYIRKLASFVTVSGGEYEQGYFNSMFEKMLVRCIGCGLGRQENRTVFVLVGEKQNTGKSSFVRFLNPFGSQYYTEAPLRDNKDTEFSFCENFIYNLEELNALSNMEINKLKAIISKTIVKERRAYAADAEHEIRRCNFFGSTNKDDFLTDTENTRWLCFYVDSINFDYNNVETGVCKVDIRKVWAQAFALYNDSKYNAQLTKNESQRRDAINKRYEVNNVEKDVLLRFFEAAEIHLCDFYTYSEIIEIMTDKTQGKIKFNPRNVTKSLKQLGFEQGTKKINGKTGRGFWAKLSAFKDYEEITEDGFDNKKAMF